MSEPKKDIIEFLKVLADQTRLEILDLLNREKKTSSEIQSALNKSQSTISQHLKVLTNKNLIIFERINNIKYYQINNLEIFKLLVDIKDYVVKINQEKLKDLRDLDIIDTLS
ncbi:MAG TPA: metalloregulator ArsR/SmtB family transcription factor [Candidatus Nanopelagicaceae bacterium]|nr:metalloregulator ArsR/SmtB family transcription factor [Candidatus Nanopelagicaceae bacterium]